MSEILLFYSNRGRLSTEWMNAWQIESTQYWLVEWIKKYVLIYFKTLQMLILKPLHRRYTSTCPLLIFLLGTVLLYPYNTISWRASRSVMETMHAKWPGFFRFLPSICHVEMVGKSLNWTTSVQSPNTDRVPETVWSLRHLRLLLCSHKEKFLKSQVCI